MAFGEVHKIVGGHASLGDWNVDAAPAMQWSDGDVWSLDVTVPNGSNLEFKARHCRNIALFELKRRYYICMLAHVLHGHRDYMIYIHISDDTA